MRSPLFALICCSIMLAASAIPLCRFLDPAQPPRDAVARNAAGTAPEKSAAQPPTAAQSPSHPTRQSEEVPVLVRYTGVPREISLSLAGRELAHFSPEIPGCLPIKLLLPPLAPGSSIELEVHAVWTNSSDTSHVITVEISPPLLPSAADTHWSDSDEPEIHEIYYFHWPESPVIRT